MKHSYRGGVVGAAIAFSGAAFAQTAPAPQSLAAGPGALEEVVVTAQKRSERLQDVPLTVSSVSADKLDAAGIDSLTDLNLEIGRAHV